MSKLRLIFLSLIALLTLSCSSDSEDSNVRVIQVAPNLPVVDMYVDGTLEVENLAYGQNTGYFSLGEGAHNIQIMAPNTAVPVIDINRGLASGANYSFYILASGRQQASNEQSRTTYLFLVDPFIDPLDGQFRLRMGNLAPIMRNSDLYITEPEASILTRAPTFSGVSYKEFSKYFNLREGYVRVRMTEHGTKDVVYDSGILFFQSGTANTVLVYDQFGGGFPLNAMILEDND